MPTALITGGTDGVGKATAAALLAEDWSVVIVGRSADRSAAAVEELKRVVVGARVSAIVADLSVLSQVRRAATEYLAHHDRLDFLLLNANAIAQRRVVTTEGFEQNFAIGHLGRALLALRLQALLEATPGSQLMTVVGRDTLRPDFSDLQLERSYSSWDALRRWQWCTQIFFGDFAKHSQALANIYMPGLVRTKILADEPQPRRAFVKLMNLVVGISVEEAGRNVVLALRDAAEGRITGATYAWAKRTKPLKLERRPDDEALVVARTRELLAPYLGPEEQP